MPSVVLEEIPLGNRDLVLNLANAICHLKTVQTALSSPFYSPHPANTHTQRAEWGRAVFHSLDSVTVQDVDKEGSGYTRNIEPPVAGIP